MQQAYKLFGSHHYDHYDFLFALSDQHRRHRARAPSVERERHRARLLHRLGQQARTARDLLPHEYTHSWNGKFRRPADLWTPNFNVPMRDSLLWVYEGQTQYWGFVLAARSGLWTSRAGARCARARSRRATTQPARLRLAHVQDTTNDPIIAQRRPLPWRSWQRSEDYYSEGQLIWLDVDTLIRELSHERRSLDDFARAFFGVDRRQLTCRAPTPSTTSSRR